MPNDYPLEHSDDLNDWTTLSSLPFQTASIIHPDGTEDVTLEIPMDHPELGGTRRFVRLRTPAP